MLSLNEASTQADISRRTLAFRVRKLNLQPVSRFNRTTYYAKKDILRIARLPANYERKSPKGFMSISDVAEEFAISRKSVQVRLNKCNVVYTKIANDGAYLYDASVVIQMMRDNPVRTMSVSKLDNELSMVFLRGVL